MTSVGTIKYKNGSAWIDVLHPVGSFYFSTQLTSPSSLFGGTWAQITNAVLRGASGVGYGGSDTHTLTINEMPNHNHGVLLSGYSPTAMTGGFSWDGSYPGGYYYGSYTHGTGGGAAFTELPRYYNCYVWYRTA